MTIRAPLRRADLPGLTARVCRLLSRSDPVLLLCDVGAFPEPDAVVVDALARLAAGARRHGAEVRLRGVSPRLRELVALMGLAETLRC